MLNLFKKNANDVRTIAEKINLEPKDIISYFDALGVKITEHSLLDENMCQMIETLLQQKKEVVQNVDMDDDASNNVLIKNLVLTGNEYVKQQELIKAFNCYYLSYIYGNEQAYYKLGSLLEKDLGFGVNTKKARDYYRMAALRGHKSASQKLSEYYTNHIEEIVKNGNPDDLVGVGDSFFRRGDIVKALQYYNMAVEQNSAAAQCKIGSIMMKYPSYETDLEKNHIYWLKLSAGQDYAEAYYKLGVCYEGQDTIVEEDKSVAFEYFEKAASLGNALAQSKLGYYYKNGTVVKRDFEMSYYWYRKGAENGHSIAQNQLAFCYAKGLGTEQDLYQAYHWFARAAAQKHYVALYQLGLCYMYGKGTAIDYAKARDCFEKALDNGYDAAQKQLDVLNKLDTLNGQSTTEKLKEDISDTFVNFKLSDDFDVRSYKPTGDSYVSETTDNHIETTDNHSETTEQQTDKQVDVVEQINNVEQEPEKEIQNESSLTENTEKDSHDDIAQTQMQSDASVDVNSMSEKQAIEMLFLLKDKIQATIDLTDVQRRLDEIKQEEQMHTAEQLIQQKGFTQEQLELLKNYFNK